LSEKWGFLHAGVGESLLDKGAVRAGVNLGDLDEGKIDQKRSAPEKVGKK